MNGHSLSLDSLDELGLSDMKDKIIDLVRKMKELKIDMNEYICLKFLILLNPGMNTMYICLNFLNLLSLLLQFKINYFYSL